MGSRGAGPDPSRGRSGRGRLGPADPEEAERSPLAFAGESWHTSSVSNVGLDPGGWPVWYAAVVITRSGGDVVERAQALVRRAGPYPLQPFGCVAGKLKECGPDRAVRFYFASTITPWPGGSRERARRAARYRLRIGILLDD